MTIYLVTGVTGNLGGAVLAALRQRVSPGDLRVLVRNAEQAEVFADYGVTAHVGDYADRQTLMRAFAGVDRVVFVSSPTLDPKLRSSQHRTVITSAVAAGVSHIVYTSGMGAPHDPGHSTAEHELETSGIGHTILRNALYTEPFVSKALAEARSGSVKSASQGHPIVTASITDLAEAAARSVTDPPERTLWELRGPAWTFDQAALTLSRLLEHPVGSDEVSDDDTGAFRALFPLIRRDVFAEESSDLGVLLGRAPETIESVARRLLE